MVVEKIMHPQFPYLSTYDLLWVDTKVETYKYINTLSKTHCVGIENKGI
jgi:hypothetical protein